MCHINSSPRIAVECPLQSALDAQAALNMPEFICYRSRTKARLYRIDSVDISREQSEPIVLPRA